MANEQETISQSSEQGASAQPAKEVEVHEMTTLHERTIAMLSYVGPLAIVPFYLKKESEFCRFHGKQGMLLAIIFFVAQMLAVLDFFMDLALILQVGVFFYMGFEAISGKWKKLPFVYDWACKLEKSLTLRTKEEELDEVRLQPGQVAEEPVTVENQTPAPTESSSDLNSPKA